jgi:hypothetical protein
MSKTFAKESDLVAAFMEALETPEWRGAQTHMKGWTAYHETAGWDLLLVSDSGLQIGVEAKLSLNAKVLSQALPSGWRADTGPDYRVALVPADSCAAHMQELAGHLGVTVITVRDVRYDNAKEPRWRFDPHQLPTQRGEDWSDRGWFPWLPSKQCQLPEYVPDVCGGHAAPVALTEWKIKAIKLLILLERNGVVHRSDMRALGISPTRWTERSFGYLEATPSGYVRCSATPDLKSQHPRNWNEIDADFEVWGKDLVRPDLLAGIAA